MRPESTRVINLVQFAEAEALDPIYFERPYYLAPDSQVAADAFAVIREGMSGKVGIGKVALYGREYLVAVQAREKGLVMYTMRQADEIRAMSDVSEYDLLPASVKPDEVKLARQVVSTFESELDLRTYRDDYQAELRRIIDAKVAGEEIVATEEEAPAEGGQPHGSAAQEPGHGQRGEEEAREGRSQAVGRESRRRQEESPQVGVGWLTPEARYR